ncbi:MAG: chemotaxis protein CheW [Cyanobacteria bacterium P01_F01_bin.86]
METSYFFFNLDQHLAAVDADYIEEVFALPELILIPEAPLGIVGVIDLRGEVLPILDVRLTFGTQPQLYQLTDNIIVLNHGQLRIGIIATSIQGLRDVTIQEIKTDFSESMAWMNPNTKKFLSGMVTEEETFFILSDPTNWFGVGEIQQVISVTSFLVTEIYSGSRTDILLPENRSVEQDFLPLQTGFCPAATPEAQKIFRQRSENLRRSLDENELVEGTRTLVVITLNNLLLGIDSYAVREFITLSQATPIPCCPTYIIGNINLRGEILTVIDIGPFLDLELKDLSIAPKAIVAELENITVGILVQDIQEVMFSVNPRSIQSSAGSGLKVKSDYIQGVVSYKDQVMHILDLPALLQSSEIVVNEMV